jgi:hypothetical protein
MQASVISLLLSGLGRDLLKLAAALAVAVVLAAAFALASLGALLELAAPGSPPAVITSSTSETAREVTPKRNGAVTEQHAADAEAWSAAPIPTQRGFAERTPSPPARQEPEA